MSLLLLLVFESVGNLRRSVFADMNGIAASRIGGTRVELEKWANGIPVVHNYGHAGAGYQSSWYVLVYDMKLVTTC